jgi:hypothetical protein
VVVGDTRKPRGSFCAAFRCAALCSVVLAAAPAAAAGVEETALARPTDGEARAALDLVYDGDFHGAEARLLALARLHPEDPVLPYLQALALEWRLEQDPESRAHDAEATALADRALGLADTQIARDPGDARALLARGAAHGVKSRLSLFRWEKGPASRQAVRMREALVAARAAGAEGLDLDFGLGLYDYYADTLPRFFRVVAIVLRVPGGDRDRGLEGIARVARGGSLFHDDEARVQMYDIHAYFEHAPDRALHWIREMWRRHPGWPLWGLKLAQLLGEPMGQWAESAAVARDIALAADAARQPNYQPVVAAMARVLLAEALLGDLRFEEAREAASAALSGASGPPWVRERGARVLGRCLDLERRAGTPEASALALLAQARRLRERGDADAAEANCLRAFASFPASDEGRLCAARQSLRRGESAAARELARAVLASDAAPWLRPCARLVLAQALESEGERARALDLYRRVWEEPLGHGELRKEAADAIGRLDKTATLPAAPPLER